MERQKAQANREEMQRRMNPQPKMQNQTLGPRLAQQQQHQPVTNDQPGLLRQLRQQRQNLEGEIDQFKTRLVGQRVSVAICVGSYVG